MNIFKLAMLTTLGLVVSGCMPASSVVPLGNGTYHLTGKDQGGIFSDDGQIVGVLMNKAQIFCNGLNKNAETISLNRDPEGPMRFETADLIFRCK